MNCESGSLVARRRAETAMGMAVVWAAQSVAEVRSVCRLSSPSLLKWRVVVPVGFQAVPAHRGNWLSASPVRQLYYLPHAGHSAGALRRDGAGSSGIKRGFLAKSFALLLWDIRAAPTARAWCGGSRWS
ncbi:hypothetical protein TcG_07037 [Trypanosoma cruzi]|nr:hypothetical protein TcG_07037 [Trypanosoma cruzi]